MAKVTYRIPSKKVQYGYVEITGDPGDFGIEDTADAHAIAQAYVDYMIAFARSEAGSVEAASKQEAPPKDPVTPDEVEQLLHDELGAQKIGTKQSKKPWEKDATAATEKPWESKPASASDWDI